MNENDPCDDTCTDDDNTGHLDEWIEQLYTKCQKLTESQVRQLCLLACQILLKEATLQPVNLPVIICGDLHGQFYDLVDIFANIGGKVPDFNYLFLGDYVDRGFYSVETISLLLCLKTRYPERITLLRGNHESRQLTTVYGFYDEIIQKYRSVSVWRYFTDVFDCMPICALIEDSVICMHGGLSPVAESLDVIRGLSRRQEIPHSGAICDLLWSDPQDELGWAPSSRGCGYFFGKDVTSKFNHVNNTACIVRAHQVVQEGYIQTHDKQVVTVFSAPNYCYRMKNLGGAIHIHDNSDSNFLQFEASTEVSGNPAPPVPSRYFDD